MRKLLLFPLRNLLRNKPSTTICHHCPSPPPPPHSTSTTTHNLFSPSSWKLQGPLSSGGGTLGLLASSTALRRMIATTHLAVSLRNLSHRGVRMLHFSLQRRGRLGGTYLRQTYGWRSFMSTPDGVLYGLIGANVAVFFLWRIADPTFMTKHFTISVSNIMNWRVHTLLTSAFSHMGSDHIFTNMIGLYVFGNSIGQIFGPQFLLKMYFAGALTGSIFYLVHEVLSVPSFKGIRQRYYSSTPGLGASGAVNAIMLFYIFLFPTNTIYLQFFVPVPAALVGAILIGSDLWRVKQGDKEVSGSAHLGGALVAALVWARMIKHWI